MISKYVGFLSICLILYGELNTQVSFQNQFASNEDTLWIQTMKVKGFGPFTFGGVFLEFEDTMDLFNYPIKFQETLTDVTGIRIPVDLKSELDYIDIVKGQLPTEEIAIVVDQNNNQSFLDDTIYPLKPIDWYSSKNAIQVTFTISDGLDLVQHRSWIRIGNWDGDIIWGIDEYLNTSITIGGKHFGIGVIDPVSGSFTYGIEPQIALVTSDGIRKDSLEVRDLIKMGEYLKLDQSYYKFDSINNDGSVIRLLKEENFANKVGVQVGILAPEFIFKSTSGDTMYTSALHDKPLIIANSCGCGGDTESSQAYLEMREMYEKEAYVLGLDTYSNDPLDRWKIDMSDSFNDDASEKFRQAYCSRICYVIGQDQRILDKFNDHRLEIKAS